MQEKIKQAYEKINISKEAKDRIQMAVMMQNAEEKKKDRCIMDGKLQWQLVCLRYALCQVVCMLLKRYISFFRYP